MSDLAVPGHRVAWRGKLGSETVPAAQPPDARRALQALRYPSLAFVFALILAASCVWDLDQLSGRRYRLESAAVTVGCRTAMSVTMAFMLLVMI